MGSGFSLELNEDRVVKGLQKLHDKYYSTNKSLYNQRLSLNTKVQMVPSDTDLWTYVFCPSIIY